MTAADGESIQSQLPHESFSFFPVRLLASLKSVKASHAVAAGITTKQVILVSEENVKLRLEINRKDSPEPKTEAPRKAKQDLPTG